MIYSVSCQVSSVKLMRLFEYNATMCHSVLLSATLWFTIRKIGKEKIIVE